MRHYPHALFIVAVACASPKTDAAGPKPPNPPTGPLAGFWKSDGYGFVFAADADTLRAYEVTQKTCVVSFKASKLAQSRPGAESAYTADGDVFLVKAGPDAAVKRLHNDGAASDMVIRRIASLPPVCSPPTPDTPAGNFEVFAETWAEHYILFDQKKADWPAVVANARAKVSPDTKPAALFGMLSAMISPFDDAHTSIRATSINKSFGALRKGTDRVIKHRNEFVAKDLPGILRGTDRKLVGPLRRFCNDQVQYGHLNDSTGYLRLLSESNYVKDSGFAAGLTP